MCRNDQREKLAKQSHNNHREGSGNESHGNDGEEYGQGNREEGFTYQESHSNHAVEFGHQESNSEQNYFRYWALHHEDSGKFTLHINVYVCIHAINMKITDVFFA